MNEIPRHLRNQREQKQIYAVTPFIPRVHKSLYKQKAIKRKRNATYTAHYIIYCNMLCPQSKKRMTDLWIIAQDKAGDMVDKHRQHCEYFQVATADNLQTISFHF